MAARETPLYQRIAAELREQIQSGALPVGSNLPSRRELMLSYGTTQVTIRSAVQVLVHENLVHTGQGKRVVVIDPGQPAPEAPKPRRWSTDDLQAEIYSMSRVCEKLSDIAGAAGALHPATMSEFNHAALAVQLMADRLWQQHLADRLS